MEIEERIDKLEERQSLLMELTVLLGRGTERQDSIIATHNETIKGLNQTIDLILTMIEGARRDRRRLHSEFAVMRRLWIVLALQHGMFGEQE